MQCHVSRTLSVIFAAVALFQSAQVLSAFEGHFALTPPGLGRYSLPGGSFRSLGNWYVYVSARGLEVSTAEAGKLKFVLAQGPRSGAGHCGIAVPEPGTITFTYSIIETSSGSSGRFGWSTAPVPFENAITGLTESPQPVSFDVEDGESFEFYFEANGREIIIDSFSFTPRGVKPTFTKHPESKLLKVAVTLKLEVAAKGTEPIEFQWYREGEAIESRTSETLLKTDLTASDSGAYYCVALNLYGSSTSHVAQVSVDFLSARIFPGLVVEGVPGESFRIEFRDEATPTQEWQPIADITLISNRQIWIDENFSASRRFYRAAVLPE